MQIVNYRRLSWGLLLTAAVGFFFASCSAPPEIHYYTLDPEMQVASEDHSDAPVFPYRVGVVKLDGGVLYGDDRIIYRQTPYEVKHWNYRRWIAPPNELVTQTLRGVLKQEKIFSDVVGYPAPLPPRYMLSGKLLAFEEWDRPEGWLGRVAFRLTLTDLESRQVVWEDSFSAEEPVAQKQPVAVVQSLNRALQRCLQQVVDSLRKQAALSGR